MKPSKAVQPKPTPRGRANNSANQDAAVLCCALSLDGTGERIAEVLERLLCRLARPLTPTVPRLHFRH